MAINEIYTITAGVASGALTGYLTNNLALKMIFKKYGPFGGVVIKTRDEFIESIADLVENELIDKNLLKEEFSREKFKNNFKYMIEDLYGKYLYRRTGKIKIGEIPGFEKNLKLAEEFVYREENEFIEDILSSLNKNFDIEMILDDKEIEKIVAADFNFFLNEMKSKKFFSEILLSFFNDLQGHKINDISGEKLKNDFRENLIYLIKKNKEKKSADQSDLLIDLLDLFDLEKMSVEIFDQLKNNKICSIFNTPAEIEDIIFSDEFENIEKDVINNFSDSLLETDIFFSDLLNVEQTKELEADIIILLKFLQEEIKQFIFKKNDKINRLIFEIIEEEIESSSGLKKLSRESIYNNYRKNMTADSSPSALIVNFLDEINQDDFKKISRTIMEYLGAKRINKYKLDFENIKYNKDELITLLSQNYNSKLADVFPDLFEEDVINNISGEISDKLLYILNQVLEDEKNIDRFIDYIFAQNIEKVDFFSAVEDELEIDPSGIIEFLESEKGRIIEFFSLIFKDNLDGKIDLFIHSQKNKNLNDIILKKFFDNQKTELNNKELIDIYDIIRSKEKAAAEISDFILEVLYTNIPDFLEGKIKETVSANLNKLSDSEVQSALEDFIGRELKPITYLGGFLGALVGGLFSIFAPELSIISAGPAWAEYLSSAFIYGGVGWLTNVIALWMIFHPYEEKYFAGFPVPFSPGIVAKNRNRFAESMGYFVDRELLEAGSTASLIKDNRKKLTEEMLSQLRKEEFAVIYSFLINNSNLISEKIMEIIKSFLDNYKFNDRDKIVESISELTVSRTADYLSEQDVSNIIGLLDNNLDAVYSKKMFKNINISNKKIGKIIPQKYSYNLSSRDVRKILMNDWSKDIIKYVLPENGSDVFNINLLNLFKRVSAEKNISILGSLLDANKCYIAELLKEKKDKIIEKEKEQRSGFIESTLMAGALYFADLDEFLENSLQRLDDERINRFFEEEKDSIKEIIERIFHKAKSADEKIYMNNFNAADSLINLIASSRGDEFLERFFEKNRVIIRKTLHKILKNDNNTLVEIIFEIDKIGIENFLDKYFTQGLFREFVEGKNYLFSEDNLKSVLKNTAENVEFVCTEKYLNTFFSDIDYKDGAKESIIDAEILNSMLEKFRILFEKDSFQTDINSILESETLALINYFNDRGSNETLNYFSKLFLTAGFDSLENNIISLFNSVKIKEMTSNQVKAMDPAEIEAMFNSFAGKYFSHLKQYGWSGGIFGLIQILIKKLIEEGVLF
ncbi:MAG: DUF445 family protein [Bacillota bacterium]